MGERKREQAREVGNLHFTLQMPATATAGLGQSQESGTPCTYPVWVSMARHVGHYLLPS